MEGKTSFLDLPTEIRNVVYFLALSSDETLLLSECMTGRTLSTKEHFHGEPALLATSRQIREEAIPVFYGTNTFQSPYSSRTLAFLSQLGCARARTLRSLRAFSTLIVFSGGNRDTWLDTILRATKRLLREIEGYLHKDALLVPFKEAHGIVWKRLSDIAEFEVFGQSYEWNIRRKLSETGKA